jgi:hypothetical protein
MSNALNELPSDCEPSWDFRDCRLENNGIIPKNCGYNKSFKYKVQLPGEGVNMQQVQWCADNCKHKWGWYFENTVKKIQSASGYNDDVYAVMSFSNKKEAFMFKVSML